MKTIAATAFLLSALAVSSFGWSEEFDDPGLTNDFARPTARMFMELVWAVNERLVAAESSACNFFEIGEPGPWNPIFPGEGEASYLSVTTNWSDDVGEYVATTSALYKAEFWEPNPLQMDILIAGAYRALSWMLPAPESSYSNRYSTLVGATFADPSVPLWAYALANDVLDYTNDSPPQHSVDRPMAYPWPENPTEAFGGQIKTTGANIPVYLVDYPIHEHPPGKTTTNQVLRTFVCQGEGPYIFFSNEWVGAKTDFGNYESDQLRIEWEGTNGWWTNSVLTFAIHRAMTDEIAVSPITTNGGFWSHFDLYYFVTGEKPVHELYRTNALEITGTLPIVLETTNFVPYGIDIAGGNSFTGRVPSVTVRLKGIRPSGTSGGGGGGDMRSQYADWNPSVARLLKIRSLIDRCEGKVPARVVAASIQNKYWHTNSTWANPNPEQFDCNDAPWLPGWGSVTEYSYTNTECEIYDYATAAWTNSTAPADPIPWRPYANYATIAEMDVVGRVNQYQMQFSASRTSRKMCAAVQVGLHYAESRFPFSAYGYPRLSSVSVYLARTNLLMSTYGWPETALSFFGTSSASPVTHRFIGGDFVILPDIVFNDNDDWFDELDAGLITAYAVGPYDCTGATNSSSKAVYGSSEVELGGIAEWSFTEDFGDYWDAFPPAD